MSEGIAAILPEARAAGVPLAIEPLHPMQAAERACVNTLEQASPRTAAAMRRSMELMAEEVLPRVNRASRES